MTTKIDHDKLKVALQRLDHGTVFGMLEAGLTLLAPAKLAEVVGYHLDLT